MASAAGVAAFALAILRSDEGVTDPADLVLLSAFDVHPLAGAAVLSGVALLLAPALVGGVTDPGRRRVYVVFCAVWVSALAAAALDGAPTPVLGFSGAAVLGYVLSLVALPARAGPDVASTPGRLEHEAETADDAPLRRVRASAMTPAHKPPNSPKARRLVGASRSALVIERLRAPCVLIGLAAMGGFATSPRPCEAAVAPAAPAQVWRPPAGSQQIPLWPAGAPDEPRPRDLERVVTAGKPGRRAPLALCDRRKRPDHDGLPRQARSDRRVDGGLPRRRLRGSGDRPRGD